MLGSSSVRLYVALLAEGVDRNNWNYSQSRLFTTSPSSRRAWIEIVLSGVVVPVLDVALLAEGVDRNQSGTEHSSIPDVALLAEGVDRNFVNDLRNVAVQVALLAEGVDRNLRSSSVVA